MTSAACPPSPAARSPSPRRSGGSSAFIAAVRAAYPELVISVDTWRHEVGKGGLRGRGRPAERHLGRLGPAAGRGGGGIRRGTGVLARGRAAAADQAVPGRLPRRDGGRPGHDARTRRAGGPRRGGPGEDRHRLPRTTSARTPGSRLRLSRRLDEMTATGWPVLMAASRKDFVGETLGADVEDRLAGTLAVTALGAWRAPGSSAPTTCGRPGRRWTWWPRSRATRCPRGWSGGWRNGPGSRGAALSRGFLAGSSWPDNGRCVTGARCWTGRPPARWRSPACPRGRRWPLRRRPWPCSARSPRNSPG